MITLDTSRLFDPYPSQEDFAVRVSLSDRMIDDVKRILRIFAGPQTDDTEKLLSEAMISLRGTIIEVRDGFGFDIGGPPIEIERQCVDAFGNFNGGVVKLLETFLAIQEWRYADINWGPPEETLSGFREGVRLLVDFQSVAFSWKHGLAIAASRSRLQTERDLRRAGRVNDVAKELSNEDATPRIRNDAPPSELKALAIKYAYELDLGPKAAGRKIREEHSELIPENKRSRKKYPSESLIRSWRRQADQQSEAADF